MDNDNSHQDNWGHTPGGDDVFWQQDNLVMRRHCEGVFTLESGDILVMPPGTFEKINAYLWAEFDVMGNW